VLILRFFMAMMNPGSKPASIDWRVFSGGVAVLVSLCLPLALYPDDGKVMLGEALDFLTQNFGDLYIVAGGGFTVGHELPDLPLRIYRLVVL